MDELYTSETDVSAFSAPQEQCCFFTGHRTIASDVLPLLSRALKVNILYLYHTHGVRKFISGGALGFDTLAAFTVYDLRREAPDIRLLLELPFSEQDAYWSEKQQKQYKFMMSIADEIHYTTQKLTENDRRTASKYLLARNRRMIECGEYCIAYFNGTRGGTAYTVSHALAAGRTVINLYDEIGMGHAADSSDIRLQ